MQMQMPDYQKQAFGQATLYGGGFGNINQTEWSDEEDEDEDNNEDDEAEFLK